LPFCFDLITSTPTDRPDCKPSSAWKRYRSTETVEARSCNCDGCEGYVLRDYSFIPDYIFKVEFEEFKEEMKII
jgi:hypothetical protein